MIKADKLALRLQELVNQQKFEFSPVETYPDNTITRESDTGADTASGMANFTVLFDQQEFDVTITPVVDQES